MLIRMPFVVEVRDLCTVLPERCHFSTTPCVCLFPSKREINSAFVIFINTSMPLWSHILPSITCLSLSFHESSSHVA